MSQKFRHNSKSQSSVQRSILNANGLQPMRLQLGQCVSVTTERCHPQCNADGVGEVRVGVDHTPRILHQVQDLHGSSTAFGNPELLMHDPSRSREKTSPPPAAGSMHHLVGMLASVIFQSSLARQLVQKDIMNSHSCHARPQSIHQQDGAHDSLGGRGGRICLCQNEHKDVKPPAGWRGKSYIRPHMVSAYTPARVRICVCAPLDRVRRARGGIKMMIPRLSCISCVVWVPQASTQHT